MQGSLGSPIGAWNLVRSLRRSSVSPSDTEISRTKAGNKAGRAAAHAAAMRLPFHHRCLAICRGVNPRGMDPICAAFRQQLSGPRAGLWSRERTFKEMV